MILRIVVIVAVAIAAVLVFAATRPNAVSVHRSVSVNAAPERIFPLIDEKVMSVFVNTDRFVGKHFETGLQNLKAAAED